MPYVNGGKYLDSSLEYVIPPSDWTELYFLNYEQVPFTDTEWAAYFNGDHYTVQQAAIRYTLPARGVVPYTVYSAWHQHSIVDRYRYEYELDWATFPPSCTWIVGVGSWGGSSRSDGNFKTDFIPADGTDPFPDGYYRLRDQRQSWASVQQWLAAYGIPVAGGYPQTVGISLRLSAKYKVFKVRNGLSNSRTWEGEISFQQTREFGWTIYDFPQPFMIFSEAECWATPDHVHAGSDIVKAQLVWQNDVAPEHATKGWYLDVWGSASQLHAWKGTVPAGSVGRQQQNFQHTVAELLGRTPVAGDTFRILAGTGKQEGIQETDAIEWTFRVDPLPVPSPEVVPDRCTCSKSFYQGVAPDEAVTFKVVIHRHTPSHDQYLTTAAYIGVSCKGRTQTLWTGTFPAGTVEMEKTFKLSPKQLAGEGVGDEVIVPVFITGNGSVYSSADTDYYWVPNSGQGLEVQPLINTPHGTIKVQSLPTGASFTIDGPVDIGGMTPYASQDVPTGQYTINWGAMVGYVKPKSTTASLSSGGTITFSGTYTVGNDDPPDDPPDNPPGDEGVGDSLGFALLAGASFAAAFVVARRLRRRK